MQVNYRPDIDGLRAIAVLSVIGFHIFPSALPGGFIGVDIFFVISGFLITRILVNDFTSHSSGFLAFYGRRVLRIFPALILVLLACLTFGWHTLLAQEYKQLGWHTLAGAGFFSNIALWLEAGYFDNASETKPLLHLWSLGIEEQFYIFWPLILWVSIRLRLSLVRVIAIIATLSFCLAAFLVFSDRVQAFYSPLSRAWELLAGSLLACLTSDSRRLPLLDSKYAAVSGLVLILLGCFFIHSEAPFPGPLATVPVIGAALLIGSTTLTPVHNRILSHPIMVGIGLISYPLYLWHWPLISFANILESGQPSMPLRIGIVVMCFALATATYAWVERPLKKLNRTYVITGLLLLMTLLALLGKNIHDRDGLERIRYKKMIQLSDSARADFVDWEQSGLIPNVACKHPFLFPKQQFCLTALPQATPTVALIGDSHAFHAYWGISKALADHGENLLLIGKGACVPFAGYSRGRDEDQCQPHVTDMLTLAERSPSIQQVILIYRGRYLSNQASEAEVQRFKNGLDLTLKKLTSAGKAVTYYWPIAEPGFDPRLCVGQLPLGRPPPQSCAISKNKNAEQTQLLRKTVAVVLANYPKVRIVDPNDFLCPTETCPMIDDDHSLFKDENHLSHYGSMKTGASILDIRSKNFNLR